MTAAETDVAPDIEDVMALSPLQEGLYSLTTLAEFADGQPADDPYVIGMAADITGTLDVALLRDCAEKMLVRHPNLRASFFPEASRGRCRSCRPGSSCRGGPSRPRPLRCRCWKPPNAGAPSISSAGRPSVSCSSNYRMRIGVWC